MKCLTRNLSSLRKKWKVGRFSDGGNGTSTQLPSLLSSEIKSLKNITSFQRNFGVISLIFGLMVYPSLIFASTSSSPRKGISEDQAVICIVAEAANQPLPGMLALAETLRRRGSTKGVYGCQRRKFAMQQPKEIRDLARAAWQFSEYTNLSKNATHWENVNAFGRPYWAKNMTIAATYGDHTFFRRAA